MFTDDINHWSAELDGQSYGVKLKEELQDLGCKAMYCVPLMKDHEEAPVPVLTIHYRADQQPRLVPQASILTKAPACYQQHERAKAGVCASCRSHGVSGATRA